MHPEALTAALTAVLAIVFLYLWQRERIARRREAAESSRHDQLQDALATRILAALEPHLRRFSSTSSTTPEVLSFVSAMERDLGLRGRRVRFGCRTGGGGLERDSGRL